MATSTAEAKPRFLNRELSQLDFNGRVLEIVREDSVPLLERVNFCAIFSANMDEFFMVRVAGLMDQVAAGVAVRSPDGLTPQAALAEIRKRAFALASEQAKLWKRTLRPALEAQGIVVAEIEDLARSSGIATLALVSVYDTRPLWQRLGFRPVAADAELRAKLKPYGDNATYMLRYLTPPSRPERLTRA